MHPPAPATGKLIHNLLCDCRMKNFRPVLEKEYLPRVTGRKACGEYKRVSDVPPNQHEFF